MRPFDRLLQHRRSRIAEPYVRPGDRLLDIGCHEGRFIENVRGRVALAVGIDPLARPTTDGHVTIVRGVVPGDPCLASASFDCIVMLATLEHVDDPEAVARECFRLLGSRGRVVLTVPHALAHHLVSGLVRVGLLDGMGLDPVSGFDFDGIEDLFRRAGFRLLLQRTFELGLNRFYLFEKPAHPA
jgi:SAM-dependent methyltransferase